MMEQNRNRSKAFPNYPNAVEAVLSAQSQLGKIFAKIDEVEAANQYKVLCAFQNAGIAQRHFAPSTGYGYDDIGRDTLEQVFASSLGTQDALVRPQIVSGTHSIYLALSGLLRPEAELLCITGKPYDTLETAIGKPGVTEYGSLRDFGIRYNELALQDGAINLPQVLKEICKP
ncbi:MAG TPA: methionine gamma-lyase family protein, partial [Clostridia bacterium]|nr:methionine gamma-lyase family protein [Clostridia bacterium]